jgi:hypothetical protein
MTVARVASLHSTCLHSEPGLLPFAADLCRAASSQGKVWFDMVPHALPAYGMPVQRGGLLLSIQTGFLLLTGQPAARPSHVVQNAVRLFGGSPSNGLAGLHGLHCVVTGSTCVS